jgi:hypothetical protein
MPVVIEARRVKKRRTPAGLAPSSATPKVKIEIISSSPLGLAALHGLDVDEGLDLDEIGEKQSTPRKQKPDLLLRSQLTPLDNSPVSRRRTGSRITDESDDELESDCVSNQKSVNKPVLGKSGSALRPLSTNKQILPRALDERAPKRRRLISDLAIDELAEDGGNFPASDEVLDTPTLTNRLGNLLSKPTPPKRILSTVNRLGERGM